MDKVCLGESEYSAWQCWGSWGGGQWEIRQQTWVHASLRMFLKVRRGVWTAFGGELWKSFVKGSQYLLRSYRVPGAVVGTGVSTMAKTWSFPLETFFFFFF